MNKGGMRKLNQYSGTFRSAKKNTAKCIKNAYCSSLTTFETNLSAGPFKFKFVA